MVMPDLAADGLEGWEAAAAVYCHGHGHRVRERKTKEADTLVATKGKAGQ
jgi:hypothetical protein